MAKTTVWKKTIKGYRAKVHRLHHVTEPAFVFEVDGLESDEELPSLHVAVQHVNNTITELETL